MAIEDAVEALEQAIEAAGEPPKTPGLEALLALLREPLALAEDAPPARARAAIASAVAAAIPRALVLATEGHASLAVIDGIARARSASAGAGGALRLEALPEAPPARPPRLFATIGAPALLDVARARFEPPAQAPAPSRDAGAQEEAPAKPPELLAEALAANDVGAIEAILDAFSGEGKEEEEAEELDADLDEELDDEADLPRPERPPVILEPAEPVTINAFYASVVDGAMEMVAWLGRDRDTMSFSDRPSTEERLLGRLDAALLAGKNVVADVVAWWRRALASPSPWSTWAACLALGSLAGADAMLALRHAAAELAADDHVELGGAALSLAANPHVSVLARDLMLLPRPAARALGVELLARQGALTVDELRGLLLDGDVPVIAAAARGAGRLDAESARPLVPLLKRWLFFPHRSVAWPVAKALLRWGVRDPYEDVATGGKLAGILGLSAAELLILAGGADDVKAFEAIVKRAPPSPEQLSAIARFGHVNASAYLIHRLADEDLADSAEDALVTLLGPAVPPLERSKPAAWRAHLEGKRPAPGLRYRRGEPWRPSIVVDECLSGELYAGAMEGRLDELRVRAGLAAPVDLSRFLPELSPLLGAAYAEARKADRGYPAGT